MAGLFGIVRKGGSDYQESLDLLYIVVDANLSVVPQVAVLLAAAFVQQPVPRSLNLFCMCFVRSSCRHADTSGNSGELVETYYVVNSSLI